MDYANLAREFDRMAGSRMRLHHGGLPLHVALGSTKAIRARRRLRRLGLAETEAGKDMLEFVDHLAVNSILQEQPLSVRYATVKRGKARRVVYSPSVDEVIL
jgi:hypothetical protein